MVHESLWVILVHYGFEWSLGAQFVKKSELNIEHLVLHFNIFFLIDVCDLTKVSITMYFYINLLLVQFCNKFV